MRVLILLCFSLTLLSCKNERTIHYENNINDTIEIIHLILDYPEIKNLLNNYKGDTVFVVRNDVLLDIKQLDFECNKSIEYIEKSQGYPKNGKFDYSKLIISFELLKIGKDSAECSIFIKTVGLLGTFRFVRQKDIWLISDYSKSMI